jgi:LPXTG-motif cell wall-anchored protein
LDAPAPVEKLASTGSDPNAIIWAVLGGLVVLAAIFLRPKRRKAQAESTKTPSDLKE